MRSLAISLVLAAVICFADAAARGQDLPGSRAMPGNDAPVGPYVLYWGPVSETAPHGRSENQWRYQLHDGRWWYWTDEENWSYYNGDIWVPYTSQSSHELSRAPLLGPIAGSLLGQGVFVRGKAAGLTMIPGDHAGAPHLRRGTVLPKYLKQELGPEDAP